MAPEMIRCEPVKMLVRRSELRDLREIAEAWGVPLGTATWALLHGELARLRRLATALGPLGCDLAECAALVVGRTTVRRPTHRELVARVAGGGASEPLPADSDSTDGVGERGT